VLKDPPSLKMRLYSVINVGKTIGKNGSECAMLFKERVMVGRGCGKHITICRSLLCSQSQGL
jgi:hypothetical protein